MHIVSGKGSWIRLIAGSFIIVSVLLSFLHSQYWLYFTGLVGIMLIISALTGFCPMEIILRTFGVKAKLCVDDDCCDSKKM